LYSFDAPTALRISKWGQGRRSAGKYVQPQAQCRERWGMGQFADRVGAPLGGLPDVSRGWFLSKSVCSAPEGRGWCRGRVAVFAAQWRPSAAAPFGFLARLLARLFVWVLASMSVWHSFQAGIIFWSSFETDLDCRVASFESRSQGCFCRVDSI